jgi:hypothetical protein
MRRIIVLSFISLDGVLQAPGGPDEDISGGFKHGGWVAPYFYEADETAGELMVKLGFFKSIDDIKKLKDTEGSDIQVQGSGNLIQTWLKHDLADELWLKTSPVTLGMGKRLFREGAITASFTLTESLIAPNGVIFANYRRAGEVKTGTVGA